MKKTFITLATVLATMATAHASEDISTETMAKQNRMSMMNIVNRSLESGLCSIPTARAMRAAVLKMDELMKDGDFKGAVDLAHETHSKTNGTCGQKYSLASMGSVTYSGTYNKLDTSLGANR